MGVKLINRNIHTMYEWLYDISDFLKINDLDKCAAILQAVLHKLRDHIPLNNAVHLSEQLPIMIRGLFFEAWDPNKTPIKDRNREEFLLSVKEELGSSYTDLNAELMVIAVFNTLAKKTSPGTINKILAVAPKGIKSVFNEVLFN